MKVKGRKGWWRGINGSSWAEVKGDRGHHWVISDGDLFISDREVTEASGEQAGDMEYVKASRDNQKWRKVRWESGVRLQRVGC